MMNNEFAFIRSITPNRYYQANVIQGIGDDAALFQQDERYECVVSCDMLVEEIHFKKSTASPHHIGYKALAVNLSDLAAMGAIPKYYLVSIAIPPSGWNELEVQEIFRGMNQLAEKFQLDLIGGDTVATTSSLVISVTVIGQVEKNRHLLRGHAQHGDLIFVTGSLGGSAAGLSLLLENGKNYSYGEREKRLIRAHQLPMPQIDAGRIFAKLSSRVALNDVSDGIASEAFEIAEASGKRLVIDFEKIPKHSDLQMFAEHEVEHFVLYGGEDYQLIGCLPEQQWPKVKKLFHDAQIPIARIGVVEDGNPDVYLIQNGNEKQLKKRGFDHFKENK